MLRVERGNRHRRVGFEGIIRGNIFRPQFEPAFPAVAGVSKTINFETQVWQYLVVDDVVKKHGIRIEGVLRQNDAIIK